MIRGRFLPSGLFRNALAPHCCDFQWLISGRQDSQLWPRLRNDGFQNFHLQFIGRYNYSWTTFGSTAPYFSVYNCIWERYSRTFSFTIACGIIAVGLRFGLTASCILAYNGMWQRNSSQWSVPCFRGNLARELLWKTDSRGR